MPSSEEKSATRPGWSGLPPAQSPALCPPSARGPRRTALFAFLFLAFCVVWFGNLDYRKLVRPDEGRYAEIAREMAVSGDWVTPRLNGIKYFEKPPLQYWTTAAAFRAFGEHEWTARLWTSVTGLAGIFLTFVAASLLFGRRAGFLGALVAGSRLLYAGMGHFNTLDMGLTLFMSLALFGIALALRDEAGGRESRAWMLAAWAAMALAVLSKGLIGVVLPAAAVVLYMLVQRDIRPLRRLHPVAGIAIFLVIVLPWFIAVSLANPEFPRFFFIHEHFARFFTKVHHRTAPWWYFIVILLLGMLPWTFALPKMLAQAWRGAADAGTFRPQRYLLIAAVVILVFFSASQSKLLSYILPMFPLLAALFGHYLADVSGRTLLRQVLPVVVLAAVGLAVAPFAENFATAKTSTALYEAFDDWLVAAALTLLAGSVLAICLAWRERVQSAVIVLAGAGLLFVQLVLTGHEALSPSFSAARAAAVVRPYLQPEVPFYSVQTYEHTLPFYIKRTVTLVDYEGEFHFGLQHEPQLMIPSMQEFEMRWQRDAAALAVMGPDVYRELYQRRFPMQVISEDGRRVIVRKP